MEPLRRTAATRTIPDPRTRRVTEGTGMSRIEDEVRFFGIQKGGQTFLRKAACFDLQISQGGAKQMGAGFLPGHRGADVKARLNQGPGQERSLRGTAQKQDPFPPARVCGRCVHASHHINGTASAARR